MLNFGVEWKCLFSDNTLRFTGIEVSHLNLDPSSLGMNHFMIIVDDQFPLMYSFRDSLSKTFDPSTRNTFIKWTNIAIRFIMQCYIDGTSFLDKTKV